MIKYRKNTFISFLLFYISFQFSYSQDTLLIVGQIIDSISKKPIPYVSVLDKGGTKGVISNDNGIFQITIVFDKQDSLYFSCIGYKKYVLPVTSTINKINLTPAIYSITPIEVKSNETALEIVQKAITYFQNNYCNLPFVLDGYYREYTKENNKYGRLIEANVSFYDKGYSKYSVSNLQMQASEDFKINALKKSNENAKLYDNIGKRINNLDGLFFNNPVRYYRLPFYSKGLKELNFKIDSTTYFENEPYYSISFNSKSRSGNMIVNANDYSIMFLNVKTHSLQFLVEGDTMQIMPESYTISFRKYKNKLFVNYMKRTNGNKITDKQSNVKFQSEIYTEFMTTDIKGENAKPINKKELVDKGKDLYLQYNSFNTSYFDKGNILPPTELEKQIERDLNVKENK
jgi:hypothetical protein